MALSSATSDYNGTTIKNIPECLILLILSFLPTIDAIRACFTCRSWRNLWLHIQFLHFDIVPFHSPVNSYSDTRKSFSKIINQALHSRKLFMEIVNQPLPLQKIYIRFDCGFSKSDANNLTSWIDHAISSGVSDLDIDLDTLDLNIRETELRILGRLQIVRDPVDHSDYDFDFSCLVNSLVNTLKLRKVYFQLPPTIAANDFVSIRLLFLDDVILKSGDDDEFTRLVKSCVNLEHLTVNFCIGLRNVEIISPKLKTCEIVDLSPCSDDDSSLVINAPCLRSLVLHNVLLEDYLLQGLPNEINAQVIFGEKRDQEYYEWWLDIMTSLTSANSLIVQNMYFGHELVMEKLNEIGENVQRCYKFNNLIHLELQSGYSETDLIGICLFLEHSPMLESMVIDYVYPDDSEETSLYTLSSSSLDDFEENAMTGNLSTRSVMLHIPRLRKVHLKNYRDTKGELYFVELLKVHQVVLENIIAFPVECGVIETRPPFSLWKASDDGHAPGL